MIGLGAFSSTLGGFIGGALSDRVGRRRLILMSLALYSAQYLTFAIAYNFYILGCVFIVFGFFGAFFEPVSRALMYDVTKPDLRREVHSMRYFAFNAGYAIGPIVGLLLRVTSNSSSFLLLSTVCLTYSLLLVFFFRRFRDTEETIGTEHADREEKVRLRSSLAVLRTDRSLLMLVIAGMLTTCVEGLWSVSMAAYLPTRFPDGERLLATLLTVNSAAVVIFDFALKKYIERYRPSSSHSPSLIRRCNSPW